MKVKDWACFEEVAHIIGEEFAKYNLKEVKKSGIDVHTDENLDAAFVWADTPQGAKFWNNLIDKRNNKEYIRDDPNEPAYDAVDHPLHYIEHPSGIECIQVTEHMGFNLGNATKYIWRCDLKRDAIEDLKKAAWYIQREIERREK